ncbi:MAG TPA: M28 family peptidase [Baekduia sp.]|uniref:M28 family peptidase n=1 Tax=Baekduia sp. TaxID=2600305 RepID=UPI002C169AEB|nr:M28 family peptidase [Baekduia sp.]HMJ33474.1 M28 family peptidase [Baekduia sp.]
MLAALQLAIVAGLLVWRAGDDGAARPQRVASPSARAARDAPAPTAHRFDRARAMRLVRLQLAAGQRPAGSPQLRAVAERLRALLPAGRFEDVPDHPGLRNVVGEIPGTAPAVVLGAHYDTEYHPPGFVGANDAAAAVATVIEVSRTLRRTARPAGAPAIRFVLFDGEEEPKPTDDFYRDALRGSKAYVTAHPGETRAMVLLDYIGNRGVQLPREGSSDPGVWRRVRAAAAQVGVAPVFPDGDEVSITDDHAPFLRAGVPAVDLIDWSYRYKDTVNDTYNKLAPASVDAVGETVVELLRTWR